MTTAANAASFTASAKTEETTLARTKPGRTRRPHIPRAGRRLTRCYIWIDHQESELGMSCRVFITMIVLVLGSGAASGEDALTTEVNAIKKTGEPIEVVDFQVKGIPAAENAAIELRKAADGINSKTAAWTAYDFLNTIAAPITDAEAATFTALSKENTAAFEHVDTAMQRKGVDWGIKIASPTATILLPHLNGQRRLANLLQAHALLRERANASGEALKDIQRIANKGSGRGRWQMADVVMHLQQM